MAQIVSDPFTRANAGNLGANWNAPADTWAIVSNQAKTGAFSSQDIWAVFIGAAWTGGADQYAECAAIAFAASDGGPAVRANVGTTTKTAYYYDVATNDPANGLSGSQTHAVNKVVAGTFTTLASSSYAVVANDVIHIEAQGTTIRALLNGVQKHSVTDSAISSGNPGLWAFNSAVTVDAWAAGDFSAGGSTVVPYQPAYRNAPVMAQ